MLPGPRQATPTRLPCTHTTASYAPRHRTLATGSTAPTSRSQRRLTAFCEICPRHLLHLQHLPPEVETVPFPLSGWKDFSHASARTVAGTFMAFCCNTVFDSEHTFWYYSCVHAI